MTNINITLATIVTIVTTVVLATTITLVNTVTLITIVTIVTIVTIFIKDLIQSLKVHWKHFLSISLFAETPTELVKVKRCSGMLNNYNDVTIVTTVSIVTV